MPEKIATVAYNSCIYIFSLSNLGKGTCASLRCRFGSVPGLNISYQLASNTYDSFGVLRLLYGS